MEHGAWKQGKHTTMNNTNDTSRTSIKTDDTRTSPGFLDSCHVKPKAIEKWWDIRLCFLSRISSQHWASKSTKWYNSNQIFGHVWCSQALRTNKLIGFNHHFSPGKKRWNCSAIHSIDEHMNNIYYLDERGLRQIYSVTCK